MGSLDTFPDEGLRDRVVDGPAREADDRLWAGRGGVLATSTWGS